MHQVSSPASPTVRASARARWLRLAAGGLLAVSILGFMVPLPPAMRSSAWVIALLDGLHVPGFAAITGLLFLLARVRAEPRAGSIRLAGILSMILVPAIEMGQAILGRTGSWTDAALGWLGTLLAVSALWLAPRFRGRRWSGWAFAGAMVVALGCGTLVPVGEIAQRHRNLHRLLPGLGFDPGKGWSRFWVAHEGTRVRRGTEDSGSVLRIEASPGDYRGVSFWPGEQDWSGHDWIEITVLNPGKPFSLGVRIDDRGSGRDIRQRFNGMIEVPSGRSAHALSLEEVAAAPLGRRLDLTRINRLALFTGEGEPERIFSLGGVILR